MTTKPVIDCSTGEATVEPVPSEELALREAAGVAEAQRVALQEAAAAAQAAADAALVGVLAELAQSGSSAAAQTLAALQAKAEIEQQMP